MSAPAAPMRQGLWLGLLGVTMFAATLPMTRVATGTADAPQLSALFIAMGRAAVAALLSLVYLGLTRAPWPPRRSWPALAMTAAGVVLGFPLFTSWAMRHVQAIHASVIIGLLPLATALVGAWLHRQRPSPGFWACALAGSGLVVAYVLTRSEGPGLHLQAADALLLAAVACAALGYGYGARLSQQMRAEHVICWALVLALPLTLPLTWASAPANTGFDAIKSEAWWAFGYVAVFSMWLGFFAWYRGLALGGTVHVSQVQLLQPFLSMLIAVPLLGETLDTTTLLFALAVIATVFIGKRMPVAT